MFGFLEEVMEQKRANLSIDNRNLLNAGFKHLINSKRVGLRTIKSIQGNQKYANFAASLAAYRQKIEGELASDCQRIIDLVQKNILSQQCDDKTKAFFAKL